MVREASGSAKTAGTAMPPTCPRRREPTSVLRENAKTHDEASRKLAELVRRADQALPVASVNWTVAEYLTYWLRQVVRGDRRPKTYQGYEGVVRLHLIPDLGRKRLGRLTAQDVRAFITRTRQECQCCKHDWDVQRAEPCCCAIGQRAEQAAWSHRGRSAVRGSSGPTPRARTTPAWLRC
jgi:hypothetical protein